MNEKQIHEILKEKLKVDNISNDMNLRDDFNTDSIGLLEIVMELEDAYDIEVDDSSLQNFKTVGDVVNYFVGNDD
ncbi:acyl carrier protein [Citroniella saccharovorans]|uniref:Acyl carrier protein n=1 Tax=Citroniella saccharovorans TaxID=2053367 RepID=A0AAW9N039_9FIRM|nr:acyl carrier protein [Citroniella saccharovorans]MEB3429657.1 acyl carrier protein [Citroniella saccharovorans]